MRTTCLLVLASGLAAGICAAAEHTTDSFDAVREKLEEETAVLIDVREESEWDAGHLEDAEHMPLSKLGKTAERDKLLKKLPKDKVVYLHCKSGGRSLVAADLLKDEGYDLRPLKAGYKDLLKAGFEKAEKEEE